MDDVARAAGVSRALVSLVMRDSPLVSADRRARVVEAAAKLGYRPNAMARSLASRKTGIIGVLLNDLHNPFFAEIMDGIEEAADREGYRLLLSTGGRRVEREETALEAMLEFRVDGVILLSPLLSSAVIRRTAEGTPVVVLSRTMRIRDVDTVVTDEAFGAQLAVQHLIGLGHTRIAHIDGGEYPSGPPRRRGYERAMRAAGLKGLVVAGDFSESGGTRAADEILKMEELPTAVFVANDLAAAGAMARFQESGLRIPDDLSIVGFDNTSLASLGQLSLTSVNQPRTEMGELAIRTVIERIRGTRTGTVHHLTAPTLVVRRSTFHPRAGQGWEESAAGLA